MSAARPPLPFPDLEEAFDLIAQALDEVGETRETAFLCKLALVLSHKLGDIAEVEAAIAMAKRDLGR